MLAQAGIYNVTLLYTSNHMLAYWKELLNIIKAVDLQPDNPAELTGSKNNAVKSSKGRTIHPASF